MPRNNNTNDVSVVNFRNIATLFTIAAAIFFIVFAFKALSRGEESLILQRSIEASTLRTEDIIISTAELLDILLNVTISILNKL